MKIDIGMFVALLTLPFGAVLVCFRIDRSVATNLSKAARNERRKLSANLLNSVGVALLATAIVGGYLQSDFFAPIHVTTTQDLSKGVAICLALGFGYAAHIIARTLVAHLED